MCCDDAPIVKETTPDLDTATGTLAGTCRWSYNDAGYWNTECGEPFYMFEGLDLDKICYCLYCGQRTRKLKAASFAKMQARLG